MLFAGPDLAVDAMLSHQQLALSRCLPSASFILPVSCFIWKPKLIVYAKIQHVTHHHVVHARRKLETSIK